MIEIEDPPTIHACAEHQVPIVWLYSPRAQRWKAYVPVDGERDVMRRHRCEFHGDPEPAWRQLELVPAEIKAAGVARVQAVIDQIEKRTDEGAAQ